MFEVIIGAIGVAVGCFFKYLFDKKLFLDKKRILANQKFRDAVDVLLKRHLLCITVRNFDLKKLKK